MPIMNVHYPADRLDKVTKAALAGKLTDVLIQMEGGANTQGGRAFAAVLFSAVAEDDWWVGGNTDDKFVSAPGKFLVHVTIPEGYMNKTHKTEVHAWVAAAILEVTGATDDRATGGSIQVIIDEVPEGNWGAGGRTISLESIAATVGMPTDGGRFAWVRAYFEAKGKATQIVRISGRCRWIVALRRLEIWAVVIKRATSVVTDGSARCRVAWMTFLPANVAS